METATRRGNSKKNKKSGDYKKYDREAPFKDKVIKRLIKCGAYVITKEALALRGFPDLLICYKGKFAGWELKKSKAEANKKGRALLQGEILRRIRAAGGIGEFVYPENLEEKLKDLLS